MVPKEKVIAAGAGFPPSVRSTLMALFAVAISSPFPPSSTDPRLLLSDWSHFQGAVDIAKHVAYGPPKFKGTIIRSGQGKNASYEDTQFFANVQKCEASDFPWMVYHVLIPNHDVPSQVGRLVDIINRLGGVLPKWIWWDVEVHNGYSKRHISNQTINALELTKEELGVDVGVYTGKWFTDGYMETQDWFSEIIWWIAQWLTGQPSEHPRPTAFPATVDISQVMMHQTTSNGNGRLVGMGSSRVDLDRWMWTVERFNEIMSIAPPPPPSGDITEEQAAAAGLLILKWLKQFE